MELINEESIEEAMKLLTDPKTGYFRLKTRHDIAFFDLIQYIIWRVEPHFWNKNIWPLIEDWVTNVTTCE